MRGAEAFSNSREAGPLDLVKRLDPRVVVPAVLLVGLGACAIGAAKAEFVGPQLRWAAVALALVLAVMLVPYQRVLDLAWPAWIASVVLLAAVLVFGDVRNGARRWLQLGPIGFQPSEFAKVAQVLVLSRYIRFRRDHRTMKGLLVPFLITLVPMALVLKEPDLGTAGMFVPLLFAMLWIAGARTRHLLAVVALGVASLPLLYLNLPDDSYQKQRVQAFLPFLAHVEKGKARPPDTLQRDTARAAVADGGVIGRARDSEETPRYAHVPYSWTDFVFVVHAEEWGFLGVALLLALWAALLGGLALFAAEVKEPAGRLLCVGAMVLLGTQAAVNMAMTMGLLPVTGVPLPFVSYGGSAMLAAWLLLALALNARARRPLVFSAGDFD